MPSPAETWLQRQRRIAQQVSAIASQAWTRVDPEDIRGSFITDVGPEVVRAVSAGQLAAADGASVYVAASAQSAGVAPQPAGSVVARAFAGVASDGSNLAQMIYQPVIESLTRIGAGETAPMALEAAGSTLTGIVETQVLDAGRSAAAGAGAADMSMLGWVRELRAPSCSRCIVLAGRVYRWSHGFARHPRCDCTMRPITEEEWNRHETSAADDPRKAFEAMPRALQDKTFGKAGAEAIRSGADIGRVVNARRGMYEQGGRLFTREGTARSRLGVLLPGGQRVRLTPEQILREAKDRDDAIRLLKRHGYITERVPVVQQLSPEAAEAARIARLRASVTTDLGPMRRLPDDEVEAELVAAARARGAAYRASIGKDVASIEDELRSEIRRTLEDLQLKRSVLEDAQRAMREIDDNLRAQGFRGSRLVAERRHDISKSMRYSDYKEIALRYEREVAIMEQQYQATLDDLDVWLRTGISRATAISIHREVEEFFVFTDGVDMVQVQRAKSAAIQAAWPGWSPEQIAQRLADETAWASREVKARMPDWVFDTRTGWTFYIDDYADSHGAAGMATVNAREVWLSPPSEAGADHARTPWGMPSAITFGGRSTTVPRYASTITHEFGHSLDDGRGHRLYRQVMDNERLRDQMSPYGQTNELEMVAEAFSQWVWGERSEVVDMFARAYGWHR